MSIKAKLKKSDKQINIDNCRVTAVLILQIDMTKSEEILNVLRLQVAKIQSIWYGGHTYVEYRDVLLIKRSSSL